MFRLLLDHRLNINFNSFKIDAQDPKYIGFRFWQQQVNVVLPNGDAVKFWNIFLVLFTIMSSVSIEINYEMNLFKL